MTIMNTKCSSCEAKTWQPCSRPHESDKLYSFLYSKLQDTTPRLLRPPESGAPPHCNGSESYHQEEQYLRPLDSTLASTYPILIIQTGA
jgi:hypothetical protein